MKGRFGPLTFSTPQAKRKSKSMLIGKILAPVGLHMHKVRFIDGTEEVCNSCKLKIVPPHEIPPSLRPSQDVEEIPMTENGPVPAPIVHDSDAESNHGNNSNLNAEGEVVNQSGETNITTQETTITNADKEQVEEVLTYHEKLSKAKAKINELIGDTCTTTSGNKTMLWTVIENHVTEAAERIDEDIGLKPEVLEVVMRDPSMISSSIFMKLMFGESFIPSVVKMNRAIQQYNEDTVLTRPIKMFSNGDFLRCMALFIGGVCYAANGKALWKTTYDSNNGEWITIEPAANFGRWVKLYRFKEWRKFFASIYVDPTREHVDPWWKFVNGVKFFNLNRLKLLVLSNHLCMDEMMVAY